MAGELERWLLSMRGGGPGAVLRPHLAPTGESVLAPATHVNPGKAIRSEGMSAPVVGGRSVQVGPRAQPGPVPTATGLTDFITVTNVSTPIWEIDYARKFLFIVNNDALGVVFVAFGGQGAALNKGFKLAAGGGFLLLDRNVPTARIFMIGSIASNANVSYVIG